MNSNDMPSPIGDIVAIAGNARQAIHLLVAEYDSALELITLKNMAIEDLNHRLEAQTESADKIEAKLNLLLTSNGLLDFDITSDPVPVIPVVNCNEEPEQETTARRPARLKDPEPNDANTDISSHQVGNIFGSDE